METHDVEADARSVATALAGNHRIGAEESIKELG